MIDGIGIDIVSVSRFSNALKRWGDRFTRRLFTEDEIAYCTSKRQPEMHLAARFAAKEAFFKAMAFHPSLTSYRFKDVEVRRMLNGAPHIHVDWMVGNYKVYLSMSHEKEYCVAQVMVEKLK